MASVLRHGIDLPFVLNEVGRAWLNMAVHGYDYFGVRIGPPAPTEAPP